jgi:hypothetical protein
LIPCEDTKTPRYSHVTSMKTNRSPMLSWLMCEGHILPNVSAKVTNLSPLPLDHSYTRIVICDITESWSASCPIVGRLSIEDCSEARVEMTKVRWTLTYQPGPMLSTIYSPIAKNPKLLTYITCIRYGVAHILTIQSRLSYTK